MVVAALLAVAGVALNLWRPLAPPLPLDGHDLASFDAAVHAAVDAYRAPRWWLAPLAAVLGLVLPWWAVWRRWGSTPRSRLGRLPEPLRGGLLAAGIVVASALVTLPVAAWLTLVHDVRWGFRTAGAGRFVADWILTVGGRGVAVGATVVVLLAAARRWPTSWPARATVAATVTAVALVALHPVLLQPLLLSTEPLEDGPLHEELAALAAAAGIDQPRLDVADASRRTTRFNALVVGLGPTERIVLFDTLEDLPDEQVVALVAHELAHQLHRDLLRGVALVPTVALPALLLARRLLRRHRRGGRDAAAAVPLLVALALTAELLATPLVAAQSRRVEAAADHRALELGADPVTVIALQRSGVVRDLAAPSPPPALQWWYGTHPTPVERILAAVAHAEGIDLPTRSELQTREAPLRHPRIDGATTNEQEGTR